MKSTVQPKMPVARPQTLTVSVAINGLALLGISFTDVPIIAAALLTINAAAVLTWNVLAVALRQRLIPDHMLGRVGATYRFLVYLAMPAGAVAGGLIADAISLPAAYVVAAGVALAVAFVVPAAVRRPRTAHGG